MTLLTVLPIGLLKSIELPALRASEKVKHIYVMKGGALDTLDDIEGLKAVIEKSSYKPLVKANSQIPS